MAPGFPILRGLAEIFQKYHLVMTNIAMEAMVFSMAHRKFDDFPSYKH